MVHLIVDGNALACWYWWSSPADVPDRFARKIVEISKQHEAVPCVAWDSPGPTWRHELMPSYKAKRPPKPEALVEALAQCRRTPGLAHYQVPGYEADDIIATLVGIALDPWGGDPRDQVLVMSCDKDMAQLVGPRCRMVNFLGNVFDSAAIEARWGVPPAEMRLLISWMGDASDGLPGVRGIGPKKAIPHALAGEIGDEMTYELAGLATVSDALLMRGMRGGKDNEIDTNRD